MVEHAIADTGSATLLHHNAWDRFRFRVSNLYRAQCYLEEGLAKVRRYNEPGGDANLPGIYSLLVSSMIEISKSLYYPPSKNRRFDEDSSLYTRAHGILEKICTLTGLNTHNLPAQPKVQIQPGEAPSLEDLRKDLSALNKKTLNQITARGGRPIPQLFCKTGFALLALLESESPDSGMSGGTRIVSTLEESHALLTKRRPYF